MEPNQAQPQAPSDNPIGDLARGFLGDLEANPDPEQRDAVPEEVAAEEAAPEGEAPQEEPEEQEAEEATPAEPEIPLVEVELEDGRKVQVPEEVKGHLMRDKDYRQKTMALAEQRKGYEQLTAKAQQMAAQAQQMAPYHAQLFAMDNRAQQLQQALASQQLADDPIEYNRTQGELAILLRNRDALAGGLHQQMSQMSYQQAQLRSQQLAMEAPKLFEEIPDLGKQEVRESLGKYVRAQGANDEELAYMDYSVFGTKLAWKAQQYDRMVKEQAATRVKLQEKTKTLPAASKSSRAVDDGAKTKQLRSDWKKGGGSIHDPNFSALLRSRLGSK